MFPFFWFSYFAAGQDGRVHVVYGARQSPTENVYDTSLSYIGVLLDACGDVFFYLYNSKFGQPKSKQQFNKAICFPGEIMS